MSMALGGVGLDKAQELEETVFEGYLEGLHEAGWQGDPQQVRLGHAAASVRFLFPEVGTWLALILDERLHAGMEQSVGAPMGRIFDTVALMRLPLFSRLDTARDLMDSLGL